MIILVKLVIIFLYCFKTDALPRYECFILLLNFSVLLFLLIPSNKDEADFIFITIFLLAIFSLLYNKTFQVPK